MTVKSGTWSGLQRDLSYWTSRPIVKYSFINQFIGNAWTRSHYSAGMRAGEELLAGDQVLGEIVAAGGNGGPGEADLLAADLWARHRRSPPARFRSSPKGRPPGDPPPPARPGRACRGGGLCYR